MALIDELLIDGLFSGLGPSSSRGMLILQILVGTGLAAALGWCLAKGIDPLHGPAWAFGILAVALIGPPVALFFTVAVAVREHEVRSVSSAAIAVNLAVFLMAIAAVAI